MKVMTKTVRKKFRKQWNRTEKQLRNAGMSEEAIAEMREFDLGQFIGNVRFYAYERNAGTCSGDEHETAAALESAHDRDTFNSRITVSMEKAAGLNTIQWEDAQSDCVAETAAKLTPDDRKMMSLIYDSGFSMAETARIMGKEHSTVMRRMRKIRRKIEKGMRSAMDGADAVRGGRTEDREYAVQEA